jgi:hypothetical protein
VDKDLRASLVAAAAAVALSALIGIIAGVGFLTLLFRAFICGLLVGAAVYGAIFLLRKMTPELLEPPVAENPASAEFGVEATESLTNAASIEPGEGGQAAASEADAQIGANVDIVLPGDDDSTEVEMLGSGSDAGAFAKEGSETEEASLLEPEAASNEPAMPPNAYAKPSSNASPDRQSRQSGGFDELDVLPDLDGFTDSFTASEFSSGGSPGAAGAAVSGERVDRMPAVPSSSGGSRGSSRMGADGADPAALAQAVRTILKRDQKG